MENKDILTKIEKIKEDAINAIPYKKGDILQYTNKKGNVITGRYKRYFFSKSDMELSLILTLGNTSYIDWSSNSHYINNPDYSQIKVIEEPVFTETIDRLEDIEYNIKQEIKRKTKLLDSQLTRIKTIKGNYRKTCIHDWGPPTPTGEMERTRDFINGVQENELKEYSCNICGLQVITV